MLKLQEQEEERKRETEGRRKDKRGPFPKATTAVAFMAYRRGHICSHPRRLPVAGFLMMW